VLPEESAVTQYSLEDIHTLALVGHAGSGKTLLAEALLHAAGAIPAMGSLERGTTVCDFEAQEKKLQHSLDAALCALDFQGKHVTLVDTPGYPDLLGRALAVLPAVDTVAVVINAGAGVEMVTQRVMEAATRRGLCRMIVVNRIDTPDADLESLLASIRDVFGKECLPINLPARGRAKVVDCFFAPGGEETEFSSVEEAHTEIIDQVVEVDENLMSIYLEQGEVSPEQLHDPFERALREGHLIPVCFTSATTGAGVKELLEICARLMPNPTEGNPPKFFKGSGDNATAIDVAPDPAKHVIAHVFKVSIDPFVGQLGVFRIHQGTVRTGTQLYVGDARKPFKVAHLFRLQGGERREVSVGLPGDLCAVAKVEELHYDAVLHDVADDRLHLEPLRLPQPMAGLAITPAKRGDEQKLSEALHKLQLEDPCVKVEHNTSTNETVLRGMGELHLRVILERMRERYNVEVETHPPRIAYRETITLASEGHHRHKKQTGGAGQFGEVYLRVAPLPRGTGFEFVDDVVGGTIPGQFIPAVEKGVRQILETGAIAGYPLQDVRVSVYDGKHHPVDSKEVAFVTAGKKAFVDAIQKARPIVLEPIVKLQVTAPSDTMGDLTGDLSSRRGRILGNQTRPGNRVTIEGEVPLAEIENYQSRLKSLTGGEGSYNIEFDRYEPVPPLRQQELVNAFKPKHED
jgi:elongation factor G